MYTDRTTISVPYVEIALITVDDRGSSSMDEGELIANIIAEAKSLGADGVLIVGRTATTAGGTVVYGTVVTSDRRTYQAIAIVYQ